MESNEEGSIRLRSSIGSGLSIESRCGLEWVRSNVVWESSSRLDFVRREASLFWPSGALRSSHFIRESS